MHRQKFEVRLIYKTGRDTEEVILWDKDKPFPWIVAHDGVYFVRTGPAAIYREESPCQTYKFPGR